MNEDIQKQGATARAMDKTFFENPYLKRENLPAATGETVQQWQAKHDAWHLGWHVENAMRGDA